MQRLVRGGKKKNRIKAVTHCMDASIDGSKTTLSDMIHPRVAAYQHLMISLLRAPRAP